MKTHTPGPWHTGSGNGYGNIYADEGRMRMETGGTTLYPIGTVYTGWDEAEDQANARLIAAAPELLAALKECLLTVEDYYRTLPDDGYVQDVLMTSVIEPARAAIRRAEEGQG